VGEHPHDLAKFLHISTNPLNRPVPHPHTSENAFRYLRRPFWAAISESIPPTPLQTPDFWPQPYGIRPFLAFTITICCLQIRSATQYLKSSLPWPLQATSTSCRANMRSLTGWQPARPAGRTCVRLLAGNQHVLQREHAFAYWLATSTSPKQCD